LIRISVTEREQASRQRIQNALVAVRGVAHIVASIDRVERDVVVELTIVSDVVGRIVEVGVDLDDRAGVAQDKIVPANLDEVPRIVAASYGSPEPPAIRGQHRGGDSPGRAACPASASSHLYPATCLGPVPPDYA
jgi:hypothetical protein